MPAHNHAFNQSEQVNTAHGGNADWYFGDGNAGGRPEAYLQTPAATALTPFHESTIGDAGGDGAHENRPPFVALNFIIKT